MVMLTNTVQTSFQALLFPCLYSNNVAIGSVASASVAIYHDVDDYYQASSYLSLSLPSPSIFHFNESIHRGSSRILHRRTTLLLQLRERRASLANIPFVEQHVHANIRKIRCILLTRFMIQSYKILGTNSLQQQQKLDNGRSLGIP